MRTLLARLSLALLGIIGLIGGAFFVLAQYSTRAYYEEITQRLNSPIAMYVTGERQLIVDGRANGEALETLARQAMVINPSVEIYLLDADGHILDHALPPESVNVDRVDLGPVKALIAGNAEMPIRGADPRNPGETKIFSAHPVREDGRIQGYLYAVLGGARYDAIAERVHDSHMLRLATGALAAIAISAFLIGVLLLGLLTRRLVRLTRDMKQFTAEELGHDTRHATSKLPAARDEIGELRDAFTSMSARIAEQLAGLEEADRMRRDLVSSVSHDLRTPLATMQGYVDTLLIKGEELPADTRHRYLEITRDHTQRLVRLVGDLFELSKLESDAVRPKLEPFSLAELLHDVVQEFDLDARRLGIELTIDAPQRPATVVADIGLMQRVLENLLRNALNYTPRGGSVRVTLAHQPQSVAVAVADTGRGIAHENIERIFERHFRAGAPPGNGGSSTGLGLAIVRRILDLHDVRITVRSEPEQGTRFEFELPTSSAAA